MQWYCPLEYHSVKMVHLSFIHSTRQTTFWPREWNCHHRPPGVSHLSSEYFFVVCMSCCLTRNTLAFIAFANLHIICISSCCRMPPKSLSCKAWWHKYASVFSVLFSAVGEDAAWCAMPSFNLCPSSVFRCSLLPADEWEEAHVDLSCMWQARSL